MHDLDAHLQTLQILSAHIKLLLDAPEHLWRLIERKKYFQAAWLFLLARVVHRALVRDDENDEENWGNQGIDVLVSFLKTSRVYISNVPVGTISSHSTAMGCRFTFPHTNNTQGDAITSIIYRITRGIMYVSIFLMRC